MSILVGAETRLLVQGLGKTGRFHADRSIAYGTQVVAGVVPGQGGNTHMGVVSHIMSYHYVPMKR